MAYDADFYDFVDREATRSAPVVLEALEAVYDFGSVVDVGCGRGEWLAEAKNRGHVVVGMDQYPTDEPLAIDVDEYMQVNLVEYAKSGDRDFFDLALCLEVAEHLPPETADDLVNLLCDLSPVVLFSAAIPKQGGEGHINEQWPEYWIQKFWDQGYACSGQLRYDLWNNENVSYFYRQNLLLFSHSKSKTTAFQDSRQAFTFGAVQPELFTAYA